MNKHRTAFLLAGWLLFSLFAVPVLADQDSADNFLARHWQRPLKHQGQPPSGFSPLEASLDPRACGICHPRQLQDWQGSLHAHAMGPGLMGQLMDMDPDDRSGHQACLHCHAPLAEQADELVEALSAGKIAAPSPTGDGIPNEPIYNQGLICAACHLRDYQVYGPPRNAALPPLDTDAQLPHGGWQSDNAFEDSRFCAACHQFEADGYALNGKLLENTFIEWQASPQAKAGESCQSCHMPERRHLWRGIHDKATVLSGVEITLDQNKTTDGTLGALTLTNTGTGHRFPTYVTPRVVMEAVQLNESGEPVAETLREQVIARQVALDLSRELFDTRLAPGESARLAYDVPLQPEAGAVRFRIRVEPDAFYRDFYQATLDNGFSDQGAETLRLALRNAEASVYTLFNEEIPINRDNKP